MAPRVTMNGEQMNSVPPAALASFKRWLASALSVFDGWKGQGGPEHSEHLHEIGPASIDDAIRGTYQFSYVWLAPFRHDAPGIRERGELSDGLKQATSDGLRVRR